MRYVTEHFTPGSSLLHPPRRLRTATGSGGEGVAFASEAAVALRLLAAVHTEDQDDPNSCQSGRPDSPRWDVAHIAVPVDNTPTLRIGLHLGGPQPPPVAVTLRPNLHPARAQRSRGPRGGGAGLEPCPTSPACLPALSPPGLPFASSSPRPASPALPSSPGPALALSFLWPCPRLSSDTGYALALPCPRPCSGLPGSTNLLSGGDFGNRLGRTGGDAARGQRWRGPGPRPAGAVVGGGIAGAGGR